MVADVGDVAVNMFNLPEAVKQIKRHTAKLIENGCKTLAMGGDHTITYPLLQAVKVRHTSTIVFFNNILTIHNLVIALGSLYF